MMDQIFVHQESSSEFPPGYLQQSRAPQILAGAIVCHVLGTVFVASRIYSRIFITGLWHADDHVLLAAWIFGTAYALCEYVLVGLGSGRHVAAIPMANAILMQKYSYAAQIMVASVLMVPKLSICLTYLRVFDPDRRGRILIKALILFMIIAAIPFTIECIFQCKPIHLYWTELRPQDRCLHDQPAFYVIGILNILYDITLIAIITPRVLQLQLNTRQKYILLCFVQLGWVAVLAAIIRIIKVGKVLAHSTDPSWQAYDVTIWTMVEINVALISAAAPGVKPLVSKLLPHLLGSSLRSGLRSHPSRPQPSIQLSDFPQDSIVKGSSKGASKGDSLGTQHSTVSMTRLTEVSNDDSV